MDAPMTPKPATIGAAPPPTPEKPDPSFSVNFDTNTPSTMAGLRRVGDAIGGAAQYVGSQINLPKTPDQQAAAVTPKPETQTSGPATPPLPTAGPKTTETDDDEMKRETSMRSNVGQAQLDDEDQWKVA